MLLASGCLKARASRSEIKHGNIPCCITANNLTSQYALGSTDAEQERLIRQAAWLSAHTERLLREAGIGPGQRLLDLGSGVGDVSLIAAPGSLVLQEKWWASSETRA